MSGEQVADIAVKRPADVLKGVDSHILITVLDAHHRVFLQAIAGRERPQGHVASLVYHKSCQSLAQLLSHLRDCT